MSNFLNQLRLLESLGECDVQLFQNGGRIKQRVNNVNSGVIVIDCDSRHMTL